MLQKRDALLISLLNRRHDDDDDDENYYYYYYNAEWLLCGNIGKSVFRESFDGTKTRRARFFVSKMSPPKKPFPFYKK